VAGKLASRLSDTLGRHVTVPEWRHMQGWAEEDVRYKAFPAVGEAAKSYDPCKGAAFQTYAYYFIRGEILRTLTKEDGLLVAEQVDDEVAAGLPEGGGGGSDNRDGLARPRGHLLIRLSPVGRWRTPYSDPRFCAWRARIH
jgi:hypothetical protein